MKKTWFHIGLLGFAGGVILYQIIRRSIKFEDFQLDFSELCSEHLDDSFR